MKTGAGSLPLHPLGLAPDSPRVCKIQAPPWTCVLRQRWREEYEVINLEKRPRKGHRTLDKNKTPCGEDSCRAGQAWAPSRLQGCLGTSQAHPAEPGGLQVASCARSGGLSIPAWALGQKVGEAGPGSAARFPFRFWPPQR